jgi:thioredoxin reductase
MLDVVVVGGGTAGLAAALVLGRARRRALVVSEGPPRNAPAAAAHSLFTRDGTPPAELLAIARAQLAPYETVALRTGQAVRARREDSGFIVGLGDGAEVRARRLLLAVGVRDELPPIEGAAALWGRGVLHCPYCHGWEVRDASLAVRARGEQAMEMVPLLLQWSRDLLLCTDGPAGLSAADRAALAGHAVRIVETPIRCLEGSDTLERIVFADGSTETRAALFLRPVQALASDLPAHLGCALTEAGLLSVGPDTQTSVPGVYAAGDATAVAAALGGRGIGRTGRRHAQPRPGHGRVRT